MNATIRINLDNAAFDGPNGPAELARILAQLALTIEYNDSFDGPIPLRDVNGNTVGQCTFSSED